MFAKCFEHLFKTGSPSLQLLIRFTLSPRSFNENQPTHHTSFLLVGWTSYPRNTPENGKSPVNSGEAMRIDVKTNRRFSANSQHGLS